MKETHPTNGLVDALKQVEKRQDKDTLWDDGLGLIELPRKGELDGLSCMLPSVLIAMAR
jgi:hypothetical protein